LRKAVCYTFLTGRITGQAREKERDKLFTQAGLTRGNFIDFSLKQY